LECKKSKPGRVSIEGNEEETVQDVTPEEVGGMAGEHCFTPCSTAICIHASTPVIPIEISHSSNFDSVGLYFQEKKNKFKLLRSKSPKSHSSVWVQCRSKCY
jgi:hypothetical protein